MRHRIVFAEIVRRVLGEALAEEVAPRAIDERLREEGSAMTNSASASRRVPLKFFGIFLAVEEVRIGEEQDVLRRS